MILHLLCFIWLAVDAFSEERIAANVLKQILKRKDVVLEIKIKDTPKESLVLYEQGKVVDYFMMVVQGHVEVIVGMEGFTFTQGAFSYFCQDVLVATSSEHKPDYTVRVTEDSLIIKVTKAIYKQALISTKLKTWENDDLDDDGECDEEYVTNVIYGEGDGDSISTEPFTTPGATPVLSRGYTNKIYIA